MEMTLLPLMDLTAPVLTEGAPLSSGSTPPAGDSPAFAALLATAALGVEAKMIAPDSEEMLQGEAPPLEMRQNGGVQDLTAGIMLQLAQLNGQNVPPVVTASPALDQQPLPAITDLVSGSKQASAALAPIVTATESDGSTDALQEVALTTMAMAYLADQQPRDKVPPPISEATLPDGTVAPAVASTTALQTQPALPETRHPAAVMPPEPAVVAQPEPTRVASTSQPQQQNPKTSNLVALAKIEPPGVPGKELLAREQALTGASTASTTQIVAPAEQKVSNQADVTRTVANPRLETLQVSEPRKAAPSLPLNLAVEVTIAEPSSAMGAAAAEAGQSPGQNSQEQQSTAPQQQMVQLSTSPAKGVEFAAAAPQPATLPISHESLLEQVRDQLVRREGTLDGNQVRLKLNPAELGELQINLHLDDQRLRVEILTENKAVKAALLDNMDSLKDILARQHIAVERFDVGSGTSFGQFFREGNRPEEQSRPLPRFLQGNVFNPGAEAGRTVAAWQPRRNALVDVRF